MTQSYGGYLQGVSLPPGVPQIPSSPDAATLLAVAQQNGIDLHDPDMQAAINSVQQQVQNESSVIVGNLPQETMTRVKTLFTQFNGVYQNGHFDASKALAAARSYVKDNHEIQGAIDVTSGFLATAQQISSGKETPADMVASFAGPMVAAVVTAGAVSAGVGAAIVAGVAIAAGLIDQLTAPKPGVHICGPTDGSGFDYTGGGNISFTLNCVAVLDDRNTLDAKASASIAPNSPLWRSFPNPKKPEDADWYKPYGKNQTADNVYVVWKGAKWIPVPRAVPNTLPIDVAFSSSNAVRTSSLDPDYKPWKWWNNPFNIILYHQGILQPPPRATVSANWQQGPKPAAPGSGQGMDPKSLEQHVAFWDFTVGFYQAWKANAEFGLNGLNQQPEENVLEQFVQFWNRAHEPGVGLAVPGQRVVWDPRLWTGDVPKTDLTKGFMYVHWTTLINALLAKSGELFDNQQRLVIHTGKPHKFSAQSKLVTIPPIHIAGAGLGRVVVPPKMIAVQVAPTDWESKLKQLEGEVVHSWRTIAVTTASALAGVATAGTVGLFTGGIVGFAGMHWGPKLLGKLRALLHHK